MVDTKYIEEKNANAPAGFSYGQMNISELPDADRNAVLSSDRYVVDSAGNLSFKDSDGSVQAVVSSQPTVDKTSVNEDAVKKLADLTFLAQNTGVSSKAMSTALQEAGFSGNWSDNFTDVNRLLESYGYNPGNNTDFYGTNTAQDAGAQILAERWKQAPSGGDVEPVNDGSANTAYLAQELAKRNLDTTATAAPVSRKDINLSAIAASAADQTYGQQESTLGKKLQNIFQWGQEENGGTISGRVTGRPSPAPAVDTTKAQPAAFDYTAGAPPRVVTETPKASIYQTPTQTAFPNATATGTFSQPLETAGLSAVPQDVTYKTSYTGTAGNVPSALLAPTGQTTTQYEQMREEGTTGVRVVNYVNQFGSTIPVTEINGVPQTMVPAGFVRQTEAVGGTAAAAKGGYMTKRYAEGGMVGSPQQTAGILAKMFGYRGPADSNSIQQFLAANPAAAARMGKYREAMTKMAGGRTPAEMNRGGIVGYQEGGYQAPVFEEYTSEGDNAQPQNWMVQMDPYYFAQQFNVQPTETQIDPATGQAIARYGSFAEAEAAAKNIYQQSQQQPYEDVFAKQQALQLSQQNLLGQAAQPIQQAVVQPLVSQEGQFIPSDAGQTISLAPFAEAATVQNVEQAEMPTPTTTAQMTPATSLAGAQQIVDQTQAAQGTLTSQIQAQRADESAVSQLQAATGTAVMMDNPVTREIQAGELVSGSAVDATKVAELNAMTQAATATPSQQATVQGQLEGLMQQFEGGETPAWAAGAMRNAQATLAARGVGASSMAGQAIIQAAMESALPIAQADAATRAQFESQNLSNRQQAAMLAAQQRAQFLQIEFDQEFQSRVQNASRIADVANMNFTAEQQVALENARAANTVNLQNLSNTQAMVMAEAAALANLDMANLNNRQQAAVQNAQNFLQMDMANLSNRQQTEIFKSQQMMQALFTDQAAENAAAQFNASSQNQVNQFFAQLQSQTAQFNAAQTNALNQFNAGEVNALREFNSTIQQQRDLFNAQNGLVIAQANAQWRQNIDTLNTAAQNEANMEFARTLNAMSAGTLDQLWQRERDLMSFAFTASESAQDRSLNILLADKELDAYREKMQNDEDTAKWTVIADAALGLFS